MNSLSTLLGQITQTAVSRAINDQKGVTAIEYGLIAALIVIGSLVAINSVSLTLNLNTTFSKVAANL